jgi:pyruvate dehydrogenase E2 component (dihydrolipoamide acetyltransferase)
MQSRIIDYRFSEPVRWNPGIIVERAMPFEITMPQLGLTMEKGTIVEWLVATGDLVTPGQEILQVETDKAVVAVEVHQEGTIARILVQAGEQVPVGSVLAVGVAPGEDLPAGWQPERSAPAEAIRRESKEDGTAARESLPRRAGERVQASWKARNLARQAGLDLRTVEGSGPGGRVVAKDVSRMHAALAAAPTVSPSPAAVRATPVAANLAAALGLDLTAITGSGPQGQITQADVLDRAAAIIRQKTAAVRSAEHPLPEVAATIPLRGVRKIVSEGMAASVHTSARVTLLREVIASELIALRERFEHRGVSVSYNDLLIQICATALREHPEANARMGDGAIEHLNQINVGLAVDTERGLLVPVVRDADRLTIPEIAVESARLIERARTGKSLPDDLAGGTFTITNLGMFGVEGFTPVINLPECCILGVGRIVRKPVACDDDTVVVRPMVTLSLVFDHRVIDGAPAARFLDRIAELIEDPMLLFVSG